MLHAVFVFLLAAAMATAIPSIPIPDLSESNDVLVRYDHPLRSLETMHSIEARQSVPLVVLCTFANCAGGCLGFDIEGIPEGICIDLSPYKSFFISDPPGAPIVIVGIGSSCNSLTQIPADNECFNVSPSVSVLAVVE